MNLPDFCCKYETTKLKVFQNLRGWVFLYCPVCESEADKKDSEPTKEGS